MRYIKLTEQVKEDALKEFQKLLEDNRFSEDKITYTFNLLDKKDLEEKDKIIINITATAYLKMTSLVKTEDKEIGWHGVVERVSDQLFLIKDILVYPQTTTAATVTTDDIEYGNWLHKEISDEEINHLRFHGHSHVNMATSPSGVDTTWYDQILQGLSKDDYYIFMILNKRHEYFIELYDLKTNIIYEKKDIIINILMEDNNYLDNWTKKQKEKYIKKEEVIGFQSTWDTVRKQARDTFIEDNFIDVLLALTTIDLKDEVLMQGVMSELTKQAPYTGYFGVGWQKWNFMSKEAKVDTAQDYYLEHPKVPISKLKKKKEKYTDLYGYGGKYGKYY
jgi:DNA gyrase/topoisomerase IV subunit A